MEVAEGMQHDSIIHSLFIRIVSLTSGDSRREHSPVPDSAPESTGQ